MATNKVIVTVTSEDGKVLKRATLVESGPLAEFRKPAHLAEAVIDGLHDIDPSVEVQSDE